MFQREVNGKFKWFENGDEDKDRKYVGEWKDGKRNGHGTITTTDGGKFVSEWRENNLWNIIQYDKY